MLSKIMMVRTVLALTSSLGSGWSGTTCSLKVSSAMKYACCNGMVMPRTKVTCMSVEFWTMIWKKRWVYEPVSCVYVESGETRELFTGGRDNLTSARVSCEKPYMFHCSTGDSREFGKMWLLLCSAVLWLGGPVISKCERVVWRIITSRTSFKTFVIVVGDRSAQTPCQEQRGFRTVEASRRGDGGMSLRFYKEWGSFSCRKHRSHSLEIFWTFAWSGK